MILALASLLLIADNPVDAERATWRYKRPVIVSSDATLAALTLPPELSAKAAPSSRDLRLVDESGREVPYILDWTSDRVGLETWEAPLKDIRREKEDTSDNAVVRSQWTIDLSASRSFTELTLRVPDVAFAWHVRVETSTDGVAFRVVEADASLFDQIWNAQRLRKTTISFDAPIAARYIRLTARSAANSATLELSGASVTLRRRLKADQWIMDVAASPEKPEESVSATSTRYHLDASSLLPFDEVDIDADEPALSRSVRVIEETESGGRKATTILGEGAIFRVRSRDAQLAGETMSVRSRSGSGGTLLLEIDNHGSPALQRVRVRLRGSRVRLLFPVSNRKLTLYYGSATARPVAYDLEGLRVALVQAIGRDGAVLGAEELNPLFKREPPLRFAAKVGAALDATHWARERRLAPIREEDVYAITLKAQDLGALKENLADLRLVDDQNRQIPFLIDPDFSEERLALKIETQPAGASQRSRYRMSPNPADAFPNGKAPIISRIDLKIEDAFFERAARILPEGREAHRDSYVSLTLGRKPPSVGPLVIGLSAPLEPLVLEVDDGDNAALDIEEAHATVRVPRIVFKAAPGNLRLLYGNLSAEPPRYDLAGLRSEVLAYSATIAMVEGLGVNQTARVSLSSRLSEAPRGALTWAAIVIAILALIALTLKTIRSA